MTGPDMDLQHAQDGSTHLRLGPVERKVVAICLLALLGAFGWIFREVTSTQATQGVTLSDIKTQQAVTNSKLDQLTTSMSNIPQITSDVATLKVQTQRNSEDIHEMQQVRKLK